MRFSTLIPLIAVYASAVSAFDNIVAFCDSYTDDGNDYKNSMFPPAPPYFQGRFSNGPTWLEYVAQNLTNTKTVSNNGYGGATTNNEDVYSEFNGWTVPGLKQQVATLETNGTANDLYIIYIGYNDLNSIINPDQYKVVNKNYTKEKICQNVIDGVNAIIDKYQAKQFLVLNTPPFYQRPVIKDEDKDKAKQLINDYNSLVETELTKNVTGGGIDLKFLDDNTWFEEQLANPAALNLSTSNGPCAWGIGNTTTCEDPENHFFFDSYQPEAKVHAALGRWAITQIRSLYNLD